MCGTVTFYTSETSAGKSVWTSDHLAVGEDDEERDDNGDGAALRAPHVLAERHVDDEDPLQCHGNDEPGGHQAADALAEAEDLAAHGTEVREDPRVLEVGQ